MNRDLASVRGPAPSGFSKRDLRHSFREVCPWIVRFARELPEESPYAAREALAGKDARTLAREIPGMSQEAFSRAFSKSPLKWAKLRRPKRNSAVVLGNVGYVGSEADVAVPARALDRLAHRE